MIFLDTLYTSYKFFIFIYKNIRPDRTLKLGMWQFAKKRA